MDMELELTGVGGKVGTAAGQPVAKLSITGLASTPVDHDTKNNNTLLITGKTVCFLVIFTDHSPTFCILIITKYSSLSLYEDVHRAW